MEKLDRTQTNPKICLGQPVIRGTRITVSVILRLLASGQSVEDIIKAYPELEVADVQEAIQVRLLGGFRSAFRNASDVVGILNDPVASFSRRYEPFIRNSYQFEATGLGCSLSFTSVTYGCRRFRNP